VPGPWPSGARRLPVVSPHLESFVSALLLSEEGRRGRSMPRERHVHGLAIMPRPVAGAAARPDALFGRQPITARAARGISGVMAHRIHGASLGKVLRSKGAFYKSSAPHPGKAGKGDVRNYVIIQLSTLYLTLDLPLSGAEGAADSDGTQAFAVMTQKVPIC
jgi:hypothetical protein